MSGPEDENSPGHFQIEEGTVKKGGVNRVPSGKRPGPPAAQGNVSSSGKGNEGESSEPTESKSR